MKKMPVSKAVKKQISKIDYKQIEKLKKQKEFIKRQKIIGGDQVY